MITQTQTSDVRVTRIEALESPLSLKSRLQASDSLHSFVSDQRRQIEDILSGKDTRLLGIVGPCSIHDLSSARDYARRLAELAKKLESKMLLIMRVYFEKPRTRLGWKGLILDPLMDGSNKIALGLEQARSLLLEINALNLGIAVEALDPIVPQYIDDLISWAAIGARTTESQTHREMASGLSMPVGFKNGTDGSLDVAVNAMVSAASAHSFLGIAPDGKTAVVHTSGNPWGQVILRGGKHGPNYSEDHVKAATEELKKAGLEARLLIDCSHANSSKDFTKQVLVLKEVLALKKKGYASLKGFMLESNIFEGRQDIPENLQTLKYGVSVTDACLGWEETEKHLVSLAESL